MSLLTKLSKEQIDRLGNGDITLLRKVLRDEEEALVSRILHSTEAQLHLQGAGLWVRSLRKLIDPSGTTSTTTRPRQSKN